MDCREHEREVSEALHRVKNQFAAVSVLLKRLQV